MSGEIKKAAQRAKQKSYQLASTPIEQRNKILLTLATQLRENKQTLLDANTVDLENATKDGVGQVMIKRLKMTPEKIEEMARGVEEVAQLPDPLGQIQLKRELDTDLILTRYTVPIGLIGVIFESRPEAFIQIAALCIKSGNCVILKGGKEAVSSNKSLFQVIQKAINQVNSSLEDCVILAETREEIREILALDDIIDLMIPRGSNALVKYIKEHTRIPVLGHADGICHIYVDDDADLPQAITLTEDSKCQYPAVCNAVETLLVHEKIAKDFLPLLQESLPTVELRGDEKSQKIIKIKPARETDWKTEYNDLILSIKIVESMTEAIDHINQYGSHHTDAIYTKNEEKANQFVALVDSSSVIVNSSTRFPDGFRYGFGAEVGISTNKIHARGPVGLEGLTLYKYRLDGKGHCVRNYAEGKTPLTHKDLK